MKRIVLPALILIFNVAHSQNVGIGTGSPAAKLDITSTNSGVLIPRIALTATNSASPLTSPAVSTLIYNTAAAGTGATAVVPGFYYWNGSAWVLVIDNSSLTGSTTVSNTSSVNTLTTTVNGVTGATVPIINTNTLSLSGNTLTSDVNGVSPTQSLSGLTLSGDVTGTLGANTISQIQGTGMAIASLAPNNLLQYNGTNWVNVTPASVLTGATTVSNTSGANTLSTTVNGVTGSTVPLVNSINNTSSANTLSTSVNGVTGSTVPIINTNTSAWTQSGGLNDVVNGISTNITPASGAVANVLGYDLSGAPVYTAAATVLSGATTVSNISAANTLSTTVNGVAGSTVPIVNSISNASTANTLSTTVNGVAGSTVPIVNSISNTSTANTLSTTVNGVAGSTVPIVNSISNASTANTLSTTVNGVAGSTVPIINSISNTSTANTLSTTVNGVAGSTVPIINSNSSTWTQSAGLTNTVNGVAANINPASGTITNVLGYSSTGSPVYQALAGLAESVSNTVSLTNNTISTTVDGATGTAVTPPNIYSTDGSLAASRTVTMGADNLTFSSSSGNLIFNPSTSGYVGIGTASPATLFANTTTNTIGSDGNGLSAASIAWTNNAGGYTEALYNASSASNAEGLAVKMAAVSSTNRLLDLSTGSSQGTAGTQVMVVRTDGKVGIGAGTPNASAALDVSSTTGGLLLPRMNTTQQNGISSPAAGLVVFNTDCDILTCYNGSQWMQVGGVAPTALAVTTATSTSITAIWNSIPQTTTYYLDVSTVSNFATFVSGYSNLNVGSATSYTVTGLSPCSFYYYRVRAGGVCSQSSNSNTIQAQTLCASCKQLLASNAALQNMNGTYSIQPGASPVSCYCDMTNNGGGWTELNSGLTSISVSKGTASWSGSSGSIVGNNAGTGCGVTPTQYTLSTPAVSFTAAYCLITRTSTVMQCAAITGQSASGWYSGTYAGTNTSNSTCTWSDGIWANATETNMSGLKLNWVFLSTSSNTSLSYQTQCSDSGDDGAYTMQWFVR